MERLDWAKDSKGWRSGPYRVELVAPRLWVVSRRRSDTGGADIVPATVEFTAGSLRLAKQATEILAMRRRRRRRALRSLSLLVVVTLLLTVTTTFSGVSAVAVSVMAVAALLRALVFLVDDLLGRPHERLREIYQ